MRGWGTLFLAFVLGGALCGGAVGWLVWTLKPSSVESTAFAALSSAFEAEAAKRKAEYEAETKVLQQQLEESEVLVAVAEERTVAVKERHDIAVERIGKDVESKEDEIAELKESEGQAESLEALVQIVREENALYVEIVAELKEEITLKDDLIASMGTYIASRDFKIDVLERQVESRDKRIKQLSGRKLRVGPGGTAGWAPITGGWGSVTVGIAGCYC